MNTSGESRDNCFLILELPFDAPNLTETEIVKAIDSKRKFWGKPSHVKNGVLYEDYLKNIKYIQDKMLNPESRKKEAENAKKYIETELAKRMAQYAGFSRISEAEVSNIEMDTGIPADYLKKLIPVRYKIQIVDATEKKDKKDPNPKPDKADTFKKSADQLTELGFADLYEMVKEEGSTSNPRNWSNEDLNKKIKEQETKLQRLPKSTRNTCLKTLCKVAYKAFESDASREEYEKFLIWIQTDKIIKSMKRNAEVNGNILSAQVADNYLKQLIVIRGGKVAEAKKVLQEIGQFYGIGIGTLIDEKKIKVCPNCAQVVEEKDQTCAHCGSALYVTCKKCGTKNSAAAQFCTQCNTSFAEIKRLIAECRLAVDYIRKGDLEQARLILKEVEAFWPGLDDAKRVREELARQDSILKEPIKELKDAIEKCEYFKAKKKLGEIKRRYPNFEIPEEKMIAASIEEADRVFEKIKEAEKKSNSDSVISCCEEIVALCRDYPGIREKMLRYPPEQVKTVTVKSNSSDGSNVIEWKPSETGRNVTYIVVRKERVISSSVSDGTKLGEFSGTLFCDRKVRAGIPYYYTVFVQRAGIISKGNSNTSAAVNYSELKLCKVECGDGNIQIFWEPLLAGMRVRAWRKEGQIPANAQDGNECRCGLTNLIDEGLANNITYGYRLCVEYNVNGKRVLTKGVGVTGIPVALPQPVDKLEVTYLRADIFSAEWTPFDPKEKIALYYTEGTIPYEYGESVSMSEISRTLKRAQVVSNYSGGCKFNIPGDDFYSIVAVSVRYDTAVIGDRALISKGKGIQIREVKPVGNDLYVFADWPKDARIVWALVTEREFALNLNDKNAERISFRKKAYDINKAFVFRNIKNQDYYISLFAEIERGGDIGYTPATTVLFEDKLKSNITYSIRVTGIFTKEVEITFSADTSAFRLPDIEIYKSLGVIPIYKNKSILVRTISACDVNGEYKLKIPLKELQRGMGIKPFFRDDKLYESCTIRPGEGTTGML